ncbi:MAG: hypothetical protein IKY64_05035 [Bacteroidaceae bacterium]|nr:hypothetical protein [Bacteroidaceae bacterium]
MIRKIEQPFSRKRLSLFSETNLPFSEKGCSFFSPPPEWLGRMAVWVFSAIPPIRHYIYVY